MRGPNVFDAAFSMSSLREGKWNNAARSGLFSWGAVVCVKFDLWVAGPTEGGRCCAVTLFHADCDHIYWRGVAMTAHAVKRKYNVRIAKTP